MCVVNKGYLRTDEKLEDLSDEREKELHGLEMRDRFLTAVVNKGMVPEGQDTHSMSKVEQDKLIREFQGITNHQLVRKKTLRNRESLDLKAVA